jgi:hypothetical protein
MTVRVEARSCFAALVFLLGLATGEAARAHALPQANGIRWLGERAVVRTNRGLIIQDELGSPYRLLCNDASKASLAEIPPVEVTSDGRLLTANYEAGVALSSADLCSFEGVTLPLEQAIVRDLVPDGAGGFFAALLPLDGSESVLIHSGDDGRSFVQHATLAGIPTSLLVAPSDPTQVYVAASAGDGDALSASLQSSVDGGQSFEEAAIELLATELRAYVLSVDPAEPARVFVRTESREAGATERVLFRDEAEGEFEPALETPGPIAMTWGAGGTAWAGGLAGLFRFDESERKFVAVGSFDLTHITCLAFREDRLYACGFHANEFGVLVSSDGGESFEWFLRFPAVTARLECSATSDEGSSCAGPFADWSREQGVGMSSGGAGGNTSGSGASGEAGDGSSGTEGGTPRARPDRGCSLAAAPAPPALGLLPLLAACSVLFARRYRRSPRARSSQGDRGAC